MTNINSYIKYLDEDYYAIIYTKSSNKNKIIVNLSYGLMKLKKTRFKELLNNEKVRNVSDEYPDFKEKPYMKFIQVNFEDKKYSTWYIPVVNTSQIKECYSFLNITEYDICILNKDNFPNELKSHLKSFCKIINPPRNTNRDTVVYWGHNLLNPETFIPTLKLDSIAENKLPKSKNKQYRDVIINNNGNFEKCPHNDRDVTKETELWESKEKSDGITSSIKYIKTNIINKYTKGNKNIMKEITCADCNKVIGHIIEDE